MNWRKHLISKMSKDKYRDRDIFEMGLLYKAGKAQKYINIPLKFCQRSTIHGLHQIAVASSSFKQRNFWVLICLWASFGMIINNYYLIAKFLDRPVLTNVLQDHTAFVYPHVSFCFTNPIYFPPERSPYYDLLLVQYKQYLKFKNDNKQHFLATKIKFADFLYMTRNNTYTHPKWSVLVDCRYLDMDCSYDDLLLRHIFSYGACFTFDYFRFESNSNRNHCYGNNELELVIYKAVDIPFVQFGDPFESVLMPSGILLMIHDRHTWPKSHESFILNEYSQINLKIINKQHLNIGKKCRTVKHRFVYYDVFLKYNISVFGKYSDCVYEHVQEAVAKYCHCQWQEMQVLSEHHHLPFCGDGTISFQNMSCFGASFNDLNNGSLDYCYLDDCEHTTYETVISQSHFPALPDRKTHKQWMLRLVELEKREITFYGFSDLNKKALMWQRVLEERLNINTISEAYTKGRYDLMDLDFVERNFMMVKIVPTSYFMDMVEETEGYPFSRLLSDIGGSVGLWLGASLISLFEIFDLIADLLETYLMIKQTENRIKFFQMKLKDSHHLKPESFLTSTSSNEPGVSKSRV